MSRDWRDGFVLSPPGPAGAFGRALYTTAHGLFRVLFGAVWRCRVNGRDRVPLRGPLLVASNHASYADPPLVGCSLPRPLYYMAKKELFGLPVLGWLIRRVNAFPVQRSGGDIAALRAACRILEAGGALIVFPEGTRQRGEVLGEARAGVGLLAARTGAPVLPVYVHNSHRAGALGRLGVVFGDALRIGRDESHLAFAQRVMGAIQKLKEDHFGPKGQERLSIAH